MSLYKSLMVGVLLVGSLGCGNPPLNPSLGEVLVPAGTFEMGDGSDSDNPAHEVTLTRSFYMMDAEVTQGLYEEVMGENPSYFSGESDSVDRPVEEVSWFDMVKFANALSEREGLDVAYVLSNPQEGDLGTEYDVEWNREANGYRLPTEAEWEYAAQGGEDYVYAGSDNLDEVGWYDENSADETHPVRQKKPNGYGLYDMSGNVAEWCWDWYDEDYYEEGQVDPVGPENGSVRVLRGGFWNDIANVARVVYRDYDTPAYRFDDLGARLLRWQ